MHPYLVNAIEYGPSTLERMIEVIPASRYDENLLPDRFTIREIVAHLVDWEPIFRGRMERVRETPGITIQGEDEGEMAERNRYSEQDLVENLAKYKAERAKTASFLRSLDADDWKKSCHRVEYYDMAIEDTANMLLGHDLYHLDQVSCYLK